MTNQQILEKAWDTATDRGFEFDNLDKWNMSVYHNEGTVMTDWYQFVFTYRDKTIVIDAERIIYSHDFAKALWPGNMPVITRLPNWAEPTPAWVSHLQAMVIAQDPIKYLGDNI